MMAAEIEGVGDILNVEILRAKMQEIDVSSGAREDQRFHISLHLRRQCMSSRSIQEYDRSRTRTFPPRD